MSFNILFEKKGYKLLLIGLCLVHNVSLAQVIPQTGSASFGLPLFQWQDSKSRLNMSVSINYHSGNGLKVDEIASNIGQGWSMMAGGVITRSVIGQPDDQKPKEGAFNDLTKFPPGYLYDDFNAEDGCPTGLAKYPIFKTKNQLYKDHNSVLADKELDNFSFNFNGRGGSFVLGKNNGNKGVTVGDSRLRIWYTTDESGMLENNIRTTIDAFYIQDENGVIYKFKELAKTKVLITRHSDKTGQYPLVAAKFKNYKVHFENDFDDAPALSYIVNAWYLSEIEDPFTQRKISFTYDVRLIDANTGVGLATYITDKHYATISYKKSISLTPYLVKVNFPDGHKVTLHYGDERFDLRGDLKLSAVDVKYKEGIISKYLFEQKYFVYNRITEPLTDFQKKAARLCLKSVQKVSHELKALEPPYTFDYYTGSSVEDDFVPPPFFHVRDIWGYYNGNNSKSSSGNDINLFKDVSALTFEEVMGLCFKRASFNGLSYFNISDGIENPPKEGYAKNGLLKSIVYPLGGSLNYEYSDNKGSMNANPDQLVGGVHVSKTILYDGGFSLNCEPNKIITTFDYVLEDGSSSSMWGCEEPTNMFYGKAFYEPKVKRYRIPIFGGCGMLGCCKYKYQYPGILSVDMALSVSNFQKIYEVFNSIMYAVGVMSDISTILAVIDKASLSNWISLGVSILAGVVTIIQTCFSDMSRSFHSVAYYNTNLNGNNPLPKQFKRLITTEITNTGTNGYTITEFTSDTDYSLWSPSIGQRSMKQRYAPWAYGQIKNVQTFNNENTLVKELINEFDFRQAASEVSKQYDEDGTVYQYSSNYASCDCAVYKTSSLRSDYWNNDLPNELPANYIKTDLWNDLKAEIYRMTTGRLILTNTVERQYSITNESPNPYTHFVEKVVQYEYDSPTMQPSSISTILSNGDKVIENYTYSGDANQYQVSDRGTALQALLNNNVLFEPIAVVKTIQKSGSSNTFILNELVTEYKILSNGDVKPMRVLENRFFEPNVLAVQANLYKGPASANNPSYILTKSLQYDNLGNLINVKEEGGRQVSYIYDYDDKFVCATIVNAPQNLGKGYSTYTSFETESFGGWLLEGNSSYNNTKYVTGERCFDLTGENALLTIGSHPSPIIVSFWATSDAFTLTNYLSTVELKKSEPRIGDFVYYEFELPSIASYVKLQGNTTIDELRLYPAEGRMSTVTYDPILGKTSECDANNRIVYYGYDKLGRPQYVKDAYGNVVKMYEYNVANNYINPDCPDANNTTFYNVALSEVFQKNDCEGDQVGLPVVYTVQAGTYSSVLSQQDADSKAEQEIITLGQNWANNATVSGSYCVPIYRNIEMSEDFENDECDYGYIGNTYTYTVPAGRYTSLISLADANEQAQDDIDANGQIYANSFGAAGCSVTNDPQWEGTGNKRCDGTDAEYEMIDMNPNSSTYNTTMWYNAGDDPDCGGAPSTAFQLTYINNTNWPANVRVVNLSDNSVFDFILDPNVTTSQSAGYLYPGNYEITITVPFGNVSTSISVYSNTQTGGSYYMATQSMSMSSNAIITIN